MKWLSFVRDKMKEDATMRKHDGNCTNLLNRRFLGIDLEEEYLKLSKSRKLEIENSVIQKQFREKMNGFKDKNELSYYLQNEGR